MAIAGASQKSDNFGRSIMTELTKLDYTVYPVNPLCQEIDGVKCFPSVRELPEEVESIILAVPASLSEEIVNQCLGTSIKRVWMIRGIGKGSYSEKAHTICKENQIDVVYGFCPLMFYSKGPHKFHRWIRKNFGKVPAEYLN